MKTDQTQPIQPQLDEEEEDLRVTFRKQAPDEEVLCFVRRCARQLGSKGVRGLHVVVERVLGASAVHLYARRVGHIVSESDADVFLAVRNAFGHLAAAGSGAPPFQPPSSVGL